MNDNLNTLIEKFVSLPQELKAKEIINELKKHIAIYQDLCMQYGYNSELNLNKEILDLTKNTVTTDDYYEAIYAFIKTLENISGKFLNEYLNNKV